MAAAWATGKICEVVPDVINMDPKLLPLLISSLVKGLADQPKIAANICWVRPTFSPSFLPFIRVVSPLILLTRLSHEQAISSLAEAVDVDPENPSTSALSPYFRDLMSALISASSRFVCPLPFTLYCVELISLSFVVVGCMVAGTLRMWRTLT